MGFEPTYPYGTRPSILAGFEKFETHADRFIVWINNKELSKQCKNDIVRYLRKYVTNDINSASNMVELIKKTKSYFRVPLRIYVNFLRDMGIIDERVALSYLKLIPNSVINADSFIPNEQQVKRAYRQTYEDNARVYFEIGIFSGLRLTEITKVINEYDQDKVVKIDENTRAGIL